MRPGRVCVVTGASSGIGRALSVALARRGGRVVLVGRNPGRLGTALDEVRATGREAAEDDHLALALDVASPIDMAGMAARCRDRYGRADMLFACAGIGATAGQARLPVATARLSLAEWQGVMDVNLHGVFLSNTAVLPLMVAQGGGDIVNICSSTTPKGLRGRPFAQAYSASKFAMAAFTEALADEVAHLGVRVTAVFPGPVNTPLIENTALDTPFGERIEADAFAEAVLDLLELAPDMLVAAPHILPLAGRARGAAARRPA